MTFFRTLFAGVFATLLLLAAGCENAEMLKLEKEKITYTTRIDSILDQIERKRAETMAEADSMAPDSIASGAEVTFLDELEETLRTHRARIADATAEEWTHIRGELDDAFSAFTGWVARTSSDSTSASAMSGGY